MKSGHNIRINSLEMLFYLNFFFKKFKTNKKNGWLLFHIFQFVRLSMTLKFFHRIVFCAERFWVLLQLRLLLTQLLLVVAAGRRRRGGG